MPIKHKRNGTRAALIDAKGESYDHSQHTDAYEDGWQACKIRRPPPSTNVEREWSRGCSDARAGSYDSSQHTDTYEEGWQACHSG